MDLTILETIFAEETRESSVKLKQAIFGILKHLETDPENIVWRRQLSRDYWKLLRLILLRSIPNDQESDLRFSKADELVMNLAFLSQDLLTDDSINRQELQSLTLNQTLRCSHEIPVMSLTEYFKSQYRILLDCYGHDRLYFRFVDLKEENARRRMKLFLVRQERSELYKSVIQEISALQNLEKLNLSIEKIQEEYYRKKLLIGRGYAVSDELRREIIGLESQLNSLLNDRRGKYQWLQVNAGTIGTKITAYDRDIEDKIQSLQELIVEETRVRQEYEALSITKEQVTPERKSTFLDECLKIIRNMIMVAGKQEKKEATPWLQREIPFDLVEQLGEFLVQSCKFDRDLFNNCKARFNRLPWILLLPSEGNGFYDSHTNILFLPLLSPRAPEVSFLTALGHYKWQMDDTEKISQLYRRLGQNRLLSPAQLEQKFITQYYIYLMGSADEEELDEESSRWFTNFLCRSEKTDSELASETTREPTSVVKDPVVEKKHKRENLNLFDLRVKDLQDKIRKSTEIKELDSMLEIRQSQQEKGKIDIIIKNVDPVDSRLETLLSVLTLQARLSRFNDLNV